MSRSSTTAAVRSAGRLAGLGALSVGAVGLIGGRLVTAAPWATPPVQIEQWVEAAVLTVGLVVALWMTFGVLVAVGCIAAARSGHRWQLTETLLTRFAPGVVRRLARGILGAGVGVGLALTPSAALAAGDPGTAPEPGVVLDIGWQSTQGWSSPAPAVEPQVEVNREPEADQAVDALELRDAPVAPVSAQPVNRAADPGADRTDRSAEVVVVRGDTLWDITSRLLGAGATDAEILRETTRWHEANREVIGSDPDLILPGQVLRAP